MRYLSPVLSVITAATVVLATPAAQADPITFIGNLSPANEVPPTTSTSTGVAKIVLDPAAATIEIDVTFSHRGATFRIERGLGPHSKRQTKRDGS